MYNGDDMENGEEDTNSVKQPATPTSNEKRSPPPAYPSSGASNGAEKCDRKMHLEPKG